MNTNTINESPVERQDRRAAENEANRLDALDYGRALLIARVRAAIWEALDQPDDVLVELELQEHALDPAAVPPVTGAPDHLLAWGYEQLAQRHVELTPREAL